MSWVYNPLQCLERKLLYFSNYPCPLYLGVTMHGKHHLRMLWHQVSWVESWRSSGSTSRPWPIRTRTAGLPPDKMSQRRMLHSQAPRAQMPRTMLGTWWMWSEWGQKYPRKIMITGNNWSLIVWISSWKQISCGLYFTSVCIKNDCHNFHFYFF